MFFDFPHKLFGRHYLIWITTGFLLGVFYALYENVLRPFMLSPFLGYTLFYCGGLFLLFWLLRPILDKKSPNLSRDFLLCWVFLLSVAFGIFHVNHYDHIHHKSLKSTANRKQTYTAVIIDHPSRSESQKSVLLPLRILSVKDGTEDRAVDGSILLYTSIDSAKNLALDDCICFTTTLKTPRDAPYSGGFSVRSYLYGSGYSFQAFADKVDPISIEPPPSFFYDLRRTGLRIQDKLLPCLDSAFSKTSAESALMKGILLGNRDEFTSAQFNAFRQSGLLHITAVSGMHVMFLLGFITFFLRRLRLPRWLIALILLPLLILFAATVAFTPSVCRAIIMVSFVLFSYLLRREADSPTALFAAALFLVLLNPYTLLQYSFLLSFGATLGILLFATPLLQWFIHLFSLDTPSSTNHCYSFVRAILSSISVSLSGTLGICYFMARFFQQLSWGSVFANIPILILASWSFLSGMLVSLLSIFSPTLARWCADYPLRLILWCINRIADFFSHPFFRISTFTPNYFDFILYLLGCFVLYQLLQPKKLKPTNL